jgi:nucleoside-diphosphate kinase
MFMKNEGIEQTLVLFKPDALKNFVSGYMLEQLSEYHTGLRIAGSKIVTVSKMLAEEHYAEHIGKSFFPALLEYISGRLHFPGEPEKQRVKAFCFQGKDAILKIREICGPTNPHVARETKPGCIRALGTIVPIKDEKGNIIGDRMDNLIHASANASDAEREVKLWFKPLDLPATMRIYPTDVAEDHFYYNAGRITNSYCKGCVCLVAAGDVVWSSDLDALKAHLKGEKASVSVEYIAAKYMLNMN